MCAAARRAEAHHIRFAQPRALGRKVSDEYTVPVCRLHHRDLHSYGDEASWWAGVGIDPLPIALDLWRRSRSTYSLDAIGSEPLSDAIPHPARRSILDAHHLSVSTTRETGSRPIAEPQHERPPRSTRKSSCAMPLDPAHITAFAELDAHNLHVLAGSDTSEVSSHAGRVDCCERSDRGKLRVRFGLWRMCRPIATTEWFSRNLNVTIADTAHDILMLTILT